MDKIQSTQTNQNTNTMLSQKTNEDYNKEHPNHDDPNQTKGNPIPADNKKIKLKK